MSTHTEKCPVCYGQGKVLDAIGNPTLETCHGCNGRGWVTVGDDGLDQTGKPIALVLSERMGNGESLEELEAKARAIVQSAIREP